jgi:hypothetical protein
MAEAGHVDGQLQAQDPRGRLDDVVGGRLGFLSRRPGGSSHPAAPYR